MALNDIFTMMKADRYSEDGRKQIKDALRNETEDRTYQIGEISQKTGLQKTANGWVKPKSGKQPGAKKEEPKNVHGAEVDKIYERPSHEQAYLDAFKDEKLKSDVKAAIKKYGATGNNLRNALYKNDKELSDKLEKMQPDFANQFIAEMQRESKPTEETKSDTTAKFETEQENAKYEEGKKGWETVSKERLPDIKKKVEQKIDYYKKYDPYAMLGKRTGLNAAQKKAVEQNVIQAKENLAFFTGQLEGINEQMGTGDSAPRVLTGDCKIRVRK